MASRLWSICECRCTNEVGFAPGFARFGGISHVHFVASLTDTLSNRRRRNARHSAETRICIAHARGFICTKFVRLQWRGSDTLRICLYFVVIVPVLAAKQRSPCIAFSPSDSSVTAGNRAHITAAHRAVTLIYFRFLRGGRYGNWIDWVEQLASKLETLTSRNGAAELSDTI